MNKKTDLLTRVVRKFTRMGSEYLAQGVPRLGTPVRDLVADILGHYGTTVLNVGARWGDSDAWWRVTPVASIVGFDPDPAECERLNALSGSDRKERYLPLTLGERKAKATLYETQEPACSSLFPPKEELGTRYPQMKPLRLTKTHSVDLTPLDDWWEMEENPHVSFIKLDTQGSELAILRGAEKLLKGCLGVEVEVEFSPLYEGQPLFADVDSFMRSQGFVLWDLRDPCRYSEKPESEMPGRLYWANAVYFRDYRSLGTSDADWQSLLYLATLLEALGDRPAANQSLRKGLQDLGESPVMESSPVLQPSPA